MTVARTIAQSFAHIVEQLEHEGAPIVTIADIARHTGPNTSDVAARQVAYALQRSGWLGRLRTRNAWEFLPGARGGPIGSADRFAEFRARQATDAHWRGVLAMESAATLHGLAQRLPEREVVALPKGVPLPKAFADDWRSVGIDLGPRGTIHITGLPSWTIEALLVGVAARPSGYRDVAGLGQWLAIGAQRADIAAVTSLLESQSAATRQRAVYLFSATLLSEKAEALLRTYRPRQPVWFGPRRAGGHYDGACLVNDTLLRDYLSIGGGA